MSTSIDKRINTGKKKIIAVLLALVILALIPLGLLNAGHIYTFGQQTLALMQDNIPILTFHALVPESVKLGNESFCSNKWIDDLEGFEEQMEYLHDNGWTTISAEEFYDWHQSSGGASSLPPKTCMITFDDGYYEIYYKVYPILKKYNFKATVFIIGSETPDVTAAYDPTVRATIGWDKINEISHDYPNIDFQSHSFDLHGYDEDGNEPWETASPEMLKEDFDLMDELGDFEFMAYPYGGYNDVMLRAVSESEIKMAFTFRHSNYATRKDDVYLIPRLKVTAETDYEEFVKMLEKAA